MQKHVVKAKTFETFDYLTLMYFRDVKIALTALKCTVLYCLHTNNIFSSVPNSQVKMKLLNGNILLKNIHLKYAGLLNVNIRH